MSYDSNIYGKSPFAAAVTNKRKAKGTSTANTRADALSDELAADEVAANEVAADEPPEASSKTATDTPPALPNGYAPALKLKSPGTPLFYLPKGALTGMPIVGEAAVWLLGWGTVGFFRSYIPPPVLSFCDGLFSPWGMAALVMLIALTIGRRFHRHTLKLAALKSMATTAIEYGEAHHQADAQNNIYTLLSQAEKDTQRLSEQAVSCLTALGALFIIGAFY